MTTVPYDASRRALLHPGDATDFFQLAAPTSDAGLAVEMARLSYLKDQTALPAYLDRVGFRLIRSLDRGGTQGFIAEGSSPESGAVTVAAFRGTETDDPTDLFADARFLPTAWSAGGRVHAGFADAFDLVRAEFLAATEDGRTLLLTGHSLGAALATLAATLRPGRLYTFGSPRVGDSAFVQLPGPAAGVRYVDCCDVVTRVPPEMGIYTHAGRLLFIDRAGALHADWTPARIEQERREASLQYVDLGAFLRGTVAFRELADHAPINYSSGVLGVRG